MQFMQVEEARSPHTSQSRAQPSEEEGGQRMQPTREPTLLRRQKQLLRKSPVGGGERLGGLRATVDGETLPVAAAAFFPPLSFRQTVLVVCVVFG